MLNMYEHVMRKHVIAKNLRVKHGQTNAWIMGLYYCMLQNFSVPNWDHEINWATIADTEKWWMVFPQTWSIGLPTPVPFSSWLWIPWLWNQPWWRSDRAKGFLKNPPLVFPKKKRNRNQSLSNSIQLKKNISIQYQLPQSCSRPSLNPYPTYPRSPKSPPVECVRGECPALESPSSIPGKRGSWRWPQRRCRRKTTWDFWRSGTPGP